MPAEVIRPRKMEAHAIRQRLKELLSSRGRNGCQGGDYYVDETDSGTYKQKVLMFHYGVLDSELITAISEMLRDYSSEWRVLFHDADEDGQLNPPSGVMVGALNPAQIIPGDFSSLQEREDWITTCCLYEELVTLFAAHGTDNVMGGDDYWLVDDAWLPLSHKIHIDNIEFLTPSLIGEVQQLLTNGYSTCVLWVQIDAKSPGVDVPPQGIRVYADRMEEDWDRDALRAIFKDKFKF